VDRAGPTDRNTRNGDLGDVCIATEREDIGADGSDRESIASRCKDGFSLPFRL